MDGFVDGSDELAARCQDLQLQQDRWLADGIRRKKPEFDGTFGSLFALYEMHEESTYQEMSDTEHADYELGKLKRAVSECRLDEVNGIDFKRWYKKLKAPRHEGGSERLTDAHHVMGRLRAALTFGVWLDLPDAKRLRDILHLMKFPLPGPREQQVTFEQAVAFIAKAHELGYPEMGLAQALQFDLTLRQTDVIGKWVRMKGDPQPKWDKGLRWEEVDKNLILRHKTSKRGRWVEFDLKINDLVRSELDRFLVLPEIGPMIVDSQTGLPFKYEDFHRAEPE